MSVNQKQVNELKITNQIINEQLKKIEQDTRELINRTIDGDSAQVSVVSVSNNKIIIEVDLNQFNLNTNSQTINLDDSTTKNTKSNANSKKLDSLTDKSSETNELNKQSNDEIKKENTDLDESCNDKPLKGILKYSTQWKKRTISESSFDNSLSFTDHDDDNDDFSFSCTDLDALILADKLNQSKKVTFNKQLHSKKVFSKNEPAIEAKPKRNKKKGKNNKKVKKDDSKKVCEILNSTPNCKTQKNNESLDQLNIVDSIDKLSDKKSDDVAIDELSLLICSSDSETSNQLIKNLSFNKNILDDLLDQQIDNQTIDDKENWSEVKSSKKVKKNRKRNDSGSLNDSKINELQDDLKKKDKLDDKLEKEDELINEKTINETSNLTNSAKKECNDQSNVRNKMSLGIKNLEIQVN